jgi:hypothetical protein
MAQYHQNDFNSDEFGNANDEDEHHENKTPSF